MNDNLLNVLRQIINEYGEDILQNPRRLQALLMDMAAQESKAEKKALVKALEMGFYTELKKSDAPDTALLERRLRNEEGFAEDLCEGSVAVLATLVNEKRPQDKAAEGPRRKGLCLACGRELESGWTVCPFCGMGLEAGAAPVPPANAINAAPEQIPAPPVNVMPAGQTIPPQTEPEQNIQVQTTLVEQKKNQGSWLLWMVLMLLFGGVIIGVATHNNSEINPADTRADRPTPSPEPPSTDPPPSGLSLPSGDVLGSDIKKAAVELAGLFESAAFEGFDPAESIQHYYFIPLSLEEFQWLVSFNNENGDFVWVSAYPTDTGVIKAQQAGYRANYGAIVYIDNDEMAIRPADVTLKEEEIYVNEQYGTLTYSLSNRPQDIERAIYSRTGRSLSLGNVRWTSNAGLPEGVKAIMNKHNVNYSMATVSRGLVVNKRENGQWYYFGYDY